MRHLVQMTRLAWSTLPHLSERLPIYGDICDAASQAAKLPGYMEAAALINSGFAHKGDELRTSRIAAGLSLREVARRAQISAPYLGDIERGKRAGTSKTVARIQAALTGANL